jgi:osmotically-inducible protein OsmY
MVDWRRAGWDYSGQDDVDAYIRNEYRAEQGAYMERRPDYAGTQRPEADPDFWGPRIPPGYALDEEFARLGTGAPLEDPFDRDRVVEPPLETRDEYWQQRPYPEPGRGSYRGRAPVVRDRRSPVERDHEAEHKMLHAAERFYENLAGAVGIEEKPGHRGRGPRDYRRSDARILDDVNLRLTDDPLVDASDIEVGVQDREVTLSGHVASRFEKRRAEDIAEAVSGVSHVQNNLRVRSPEG